MMDIFGKAILAVILGVIIFIAAGALLALTLWTTDLPYWAQCVARAWGIVAGVIVFVQTIKDK